MVMICPNADEASPTLEANITPGAREVDSEVSLSEWLDIETEDKGNGVLIFDSLVPILDGECIECEVGTVLAKKDFVFSGVRFAELDERADFVTCDTNAFEVVSIF